MIFRKRPKNPPAILTTRGKKATEKLKEQWNARGRAFKSDDFDSSIYAHPSVIKSLTEGDIEKCYYCEVPYKPAAFGTVDHFRPKVVVNNTGRKADKQPGYYWLAYEWTNLLIACPRCNIRIKRNKFPLERGSPRALSHEDSIEDERPLLIDPTQTDPALHIGWRDEIPRALNTSLHGQVTIEVLQLDSSKLNRALIKYRRQYLEALWLVFELLNVNPAHLGAGRYIATALDEKSAFCAMTTAAIHSWRHGGFPTFDAPAD